MDKATKKLALSKETLRSLNDDELVDVVGGARGSVVCIDTVVCQSGVCASVVCNSAVCNSGAVCQSAVGC